MLRLRLILKTIWSAFHKRKILLLSLIVLFISLPLAYLVYRYQPKLEAAWYDDSFAYRKAVNITNSSGSTLTDFQVSFTLDTASLISAGKMQSDCDDIRITDVNGKVLPHWIEENNPGCNNAATKIWTKVPSITTSGATVYIYYGNPSATNTQNGDRVFEFFDDFNDGMFDSQKWTRGNSGAGSDSETSGVITITSGGDWWGTSDSSRYVVSIYAAGNSFITEAKVNSFPANAYGRFFGIRSSSDTNAKMFVLLGDSDGSHITNVYRDSIGGYADWYGENTGITNPGVGKIAKFIVNGDTVTSYYNNSQTNTRTVSGWGLQYVALTDTENAGSQFDWVIIRKYAATEPTVGSPTNEEKTQGPVAYWKFDEGYGTTTNDQTPNNNDGTITGATWKSEDQCISGKCLYFDGTDDAVSVNSTSSINPSVFTLSYWIKDLGQDAGFERITSKSNDSFETALATDGSLKYYYPTGWNDTGYDLTKNNWTHLAFVYNGTTLTIYANGINIYSNSASITLSGNWRFGCRESGNVECAKIYLDDVKIYNYARTAAQIKADYLAGKAKMASVKGSSAALGSPKEQGDYLSNGLVGYWKFDENTGTSVTDYSGYNQTLTITYKSGVNPSAWGPGKFGSAYQDAGYDYPNDEAAHGNWLAPQQTDFSVSVWIKPSATEPSTSGFIIARWWGSCSDTYQPGWALEYATSTNKLTFKIAADSCGPDGSITSNQALTPETWYHVVITHKTGESINLYINGVLDTTASYTLGLNPTPPRLSFGCGANNNDCGYPGLTDEARIYNRVLSPKEIQDLYNWTPGPRLYLKMDEGTGTNLYDSSGNSRTGSIINGIWGVGKFGKGVSLDGSGDYVQISDF